MPWHEPPIEPEYGEWWACQHPERPLDELMCIDVDFCPACVLKVQAVLAIEGDDGTLWFDMADDDQPALTLTELLAATSSRVRKSVTAVD
jgi:hypothetical protein